MYTNEIPCEERGVQILTQQVRVGILVMDPGLLFRPPAPVLLPPHDYCLSPSRLNLHVGSNRAVATNIPFLLVTPAYPATIRICRYPSLHILTSTSEPGMRQRPSQSPPIAPQPPSLANPSAYGTNRALHTYRH